MRIRKDMINWLELLKAVPKGEGGGGGALLAPYMEYPPQDKELKYVQQWHIRGRSVHTDFRMEVNDHLVGWTILTPGGISKPAATVEEGKAAIKATGFEFKSDVKNKGFRAETKARQPKVWLTVEGVVKPGEVGATKEHPGVLVIVDTGKVYFGTQKPYFHEYFIKSNKKDGPFSSGDWTRIVVRAVNVSVIDPECVASDTLILTRAGLKEAREVKIGDFLLSAKGRWVRVSSVYPQQDKEQYKLKVLFSPAFQVNGKHPFLTNELPPELNRSKMNNRQRKRRMKYFRPVFKKASELKVGDILLFPLSKFREEFVGTYNEGKLLGFFLGDGHCPKRGQVISLAFNKLKERSKANEYLNLLRSTLSGESWIVEYPYNNELRIYSRNRDFFAKVLKDGEKVIPETFLYANKSFIQGLLDGLRDADGSRRFEGFSNRNKNLIGMASLLAFKLGFVPFLSKYQAKDGVDYSLHWSRSKTSRKYIDYSEYGYLGFRLLKKVKANPKPLINIEVENDTFCLPFVATHNTKKPKEGTELMWRVLVPGDQVPYAIDRGFKKKWVPPKGYIPVPPEWRKGEKYEAWEKWVKDAWAGRRTEAPAKEKEEKARSLEELPFADFKNWADCIRKTKADHPDWSEERCKKYCGAIKAKTEGSGEKFVVHYLSYQGQIVVRGIPHQRWFLRLKEGDKTRSWSADIDFTRFSPAALEFEGIVDSKWFDYEGDIKPNTKYNPSKSLTAKMRVMDKGSCSVDTETVEGAERLSINFHGKELQGKHVVMQEEKSSPMYTIEKLAENLEQATFVLQLHEIETKQGLKSHYDIRISRGFEFNIWGDPLGISKEGESLPANYKICRDIKAWMAIDKPKTPMKVGSLQTYVTPIDKGKVTLIDQSPPRFYSMQFEGEKLKGYWVYLEREGLGFFERAKVPHPLSGGDPTKGDFYTPFKEIRKGGWDYFWLEIYDQKEFSRCVDNPEKYLPDLDKPEEVQEILVCLYPRPGTIHGVRVSRVRFSDKWTVTEASDWIKNNKLHTWSGQLIREERTTKEDETLIKIVEDTIKKREQKSKEERLLELELKKKKLEEEEEE